MHYFGVELIARICVLLICGCLCVDIVCVCVFVSVCVCLMLQVHERYIKMFEAKGADKYVRSAEQV